uniref:L-threonylcarbamoyladenylate synthase n=1 Tax=Mitsuokella sp. TaxID=2049034 RepID=UPI003D7EAD8B
MQTEIVKITDVRTQQEDLQRAGKILRSGGLVAFPTETVYGLGANGLDFYRRLAKDAPAMLTDGGFMALEVGIHQAEDVAKLAK